MGNSITIIFGVVGRDAELRTLQDGKKVANFSVAVSRGQDNPTTWFNVSAWDNLADVAISYIKKGMSVQVQGRVSAGAYIANDGTAKADLRLSAFDIQLPTKRESQGGDYAPEGSADDGPPPADHQNDIPF